MLACIILSSFILVSCGTPIKPVAAAEPWLATAPQTRQAVLDTLAAEGSTPARNDALPLLHKAQDEIAQNSPQSRAAAIDDAYDAALLLINRRIDPALTARTFDGFLLPLLPDASSDPARYDGRRLLLKTAATVYGTAGQTDRQLAVLMLLRHEAGSNENLQDWVSLQLSAIYARRKQYAPAVDALQAVKTRVMMGPVVSFEELQRKADAQNISRKKPAHAKPSHAKPHKKGLAHR